MDIPELAKKPEAEHPETVVAEIKPWFQEHLEAVIFLGLALLCLGGVIAFCALKFFR
jgi:hypothetical protein